ncbi:MAG TPA: DUF885 family protein [Vicinamibacteria bacterium]|nr:DUF885 family protein [Vicinamibacteria bacterium]
MRIRRRALAIAMVVLSGDAMAAPAESDYAQLLGLFREWRAFQPPPSTNGVPDYTPRAMDEQRRGLAAFQARLAAIDTSGWPVSQRVDWDLVRAEMNGLDFDHRVLRPWARDPAFYRVIHPSESDIPSLVEGPLLAGSIYLWRYTPPLSATDLAELSARLRAIPALLEQAKGNLVEDVRDLWLLGIRVKKDESEALDAFEKQAAPHHPGLAADVRGARAAVDAFGKWLEAELPRKRGRAGVGVENYDWYLRNVHLVPYTWRDEVALFERELARARSQLALLRHRNAGLPELEVAGSAELHEQRSNAAVTELVRFLKERAVMGVPDYVDPALRARLSRFVPPDRPRDFFTQVDLREPLLMRCHGIHWFDLARMAREPHASPIRRGSLLYNIWDGRAEGLATAMEELMLGAGLLEGRPRAEELVFVLVANRAARGLAGLKVHAGELTVEQALRFAADNTPYGWLIPDGETNWGEQQLYLQQPGYGTSYLTGKAQIERLLGERAGGLRERFSLRAFFDEFFASGMIPVSLIRWEMTGDETELKRLR